MSQQKNRLQCDRCKKCNLDAPFAQWQQENDIISLTLEDGFLVLNYSCEINVLEIDLDNEPLETESEYSTQIETSTVKIPIRFCPICGEEFEPHREPLPCDMCSTESEYGMLRGIIYHTFWYESIELRLRSNCLEVLYRDAEDDIELVGKIILNYCPICGDKLKPPTVYKD